MGHNRMCVWEPDCRTDPTAMPFRPDSIHLLFLGSLKDTFQRVKKNKWYENIIFLEKIVFIFNFVLYILFIFPGNVSSSAKRKI